MEITAPFTHCLKQPVFVLFYRYPSPLYWNEDEIRYYYIIALVNFSTLVWSHVINIPLGVNHVPHYHHRQISRGRSTVSRVSGSPPAIPPEAISLQHLPQHSRAQSALQLHKCSIGRRNNPKCIYCWYGFNIKTLFYATIQQFGVW